MYRALVISPPLNGFFFFLVHVSTLILGVVHSCLRASVARKLINTHQIDS